MLEIIAMLDRLIQVMDRRKPFAEEMRAWANANPEEWSCIVIRLAEITSAK